nr:hypothetical protein [Tanacetum cinerariifolium]
MATWGVGGVSGYCSNEMGVHRNSCGGEGDFGGKFWLGALFGLLEFEDLEEFLTLVVSFVTEFLILHFGWIRNRRLKNAPSKHLVFEEPELDKQELGKMEVGKLRVDKQEREENQEVEFDLTSSEKDSWYFLGCS